MSDDRDASSDSTSRATSMTTATPVPVGQATAAAGAGAGAGDRSPVPSSAAPARAAEGGGVDTGGIELRPTTSGGIQRTRSDAEILANRTGTSIVVPVERAVSSPAIPTQDIFIEVHGTTNVITERLDRSASSEGAAATQHHHRSPLVTKAEEEAGTSSTTEKILVNGSFYVNIVLAIIKIAGTIQSFSLVMIASTLDSMLDLLSAAILYFTSRSASKQDLKKYPVGKRRLAPLGVVIFASVMGTSTATMIVQAVTSLTGGAYDPNIDLFVIVVLSLTIALKLFLFIVCFIFGRKFLVVQALRDDHRNDIISNSFAIAALLLIQWKPDVLWWLDATFAICVGIFIIVTWVRTGWEQVKHLTGRAAEPEFTQELVHMVTTFDEQLQLDKIRAYHFGENYLVELEIILPADMTVRDSHEIGLRLQQAVEHIAQVERCFVHIDYKARPHEEHFDPATGALGTFEA